MRRQDSALALLRSILLLAILAGGSVAQAQKILESSGSWHNGSNWSGGSVPTASNPVIISALSGRNADIYQGNAASGNTFVGNQAGRSGSVYLYNSRDWTVSGSLNIGYLGTGFLSISNGSAVYSSLGTLGDGSTGDGTAVVSGQWINSGNFYVGRQGTGDITIQSTGIVQSSDGFVGASSDAIGTVDVRGLWSNNDELRIGDNGQGTLEIRSGGKVTSAVGRVGFSSGGVGTVLVTGANSWWQNNATIALGTSGSGTITIEAGGRISATQVNFTNTSVSTAGQATLYLKGTSSSRGVLETGFLKEGFGSGSGMVYFNGGILRSLSDQTELFQDFESADIVVQSAGAFIDTQAFHTGTTLDLGGAGGLTKLGTGSLALGGSNTYSGITTVTDGTLVLSGSLAAGALIEASGTLTGNGHIAGGTTIHGIHRPGSSPGLPSFGSSLSYGSGATIYWELQSHTEASIDRGVAYDGINVAGNLNVDGPTHLHLAFGGSVDWADSDYWSTSRQWLFFQVSGLTINPSNMSVASSDWLDGGGKKFQDWLSGGGFDLLLDGSDVYVVYTPLPEPARGALLLAAALACLMRRTRRRPIQITV